MPKFTLVLVGAAMCLVVTLAAPAHAQLVHTWVASNGNDAATCDRPTPCKTFGVAFNKTSAGGEITCVDSGNYGPVVINKSLTINCESTIGSNTANGFNVISILTVITTATDVVTLRGLDLDGAGVVQSTPIGLIDFTGAGALHVDKVKINNMRGTGNGIRFAPNGPARLDVSDSFIADNGDNTTTAGILIQPASGGYANVSVSRTDLKGNVNGIFVDGSSGPVNLNVRDSLVTGSSNSGIVVYTPGPSVTALIDRTTVNYSLNTGVAVAGAAATVRIGNSTISNNITGVVALSGGSLLSFKNNQIKANSTNGTPIAAAESLD